MLHREPARQPRLQACSSLPHTELYNLPAVWPPVPRFLICKTGTMGLLHGSLR